MVKLSLNYVASCQKLPASQDIIICMHKHLIIIPKAKNDETWGKLAYQMIRSFELYT